MISFRLAESRHDYGLCVAIRTVVFAVEQQVELEREIDEHETACRHLVGREGAIPFGTARWRRYRPGVAKIERVAVREAWRGRRLGLALMDATVADIMQVWPEVETLRLEAQDYAIPFYQKLGFAVVGGGFLDANIPHHAMEKPAHPR